MNDYKFGNFVCSLREKKGLTQAQLATQLNVTAAAVSKWENGESKPRVDVLFKLAEILGVRAEELIAGEYLMDNTLDPETVKNIKEQYLYLQRVQSYSKASVKLRRILAWIIDWNIIGFSTLTFTSLVASILFNNQTEFSAAQFIALLVCILAYPICFMLRDLIFGGRSLGKRIVGLVVLDIQTGDKPKWWQLLLRNLFLIIFQVDLIIMLVRGRSIGDSAFHTVVVPKKSYQAKKNNSYDNINAEMINSYTPPKPTTARKRKKVWMIIVPSVIAFVLVLVTIILVSFHFVKKSPQYDVAYTYLITSEAFNELGVDEDKVIMTSYSSSTYRGKNTEPHYNVKFTFMVGFKSMEIICHKENDLWYVCEDCTAFS